MPTKLLILIVLISSATQAQDVFKRELGLMGSNKRNENWLRRYW
jgi:hypothetical protein